jgi:trigger factor
MNYNIEDIGATKKKITMEIPAETVQAEIDQMVTTLRKQTRLKGFRPGKVPTGMVKKMFGPHLEQEVTEKLINAHLPEALETIGDNLASQPVLEDQSFTEGQPFRFSVVFEVKPSFEVTGYEGLSLTREKVNLTDEMVDKKLEDLRQAYANIKTVESDRPLAKGDWAVIDYKAFEGQEPVEGAANPNYQLEVGAARFHPEFETQLEGMNKGQENEITVSFDANHYNPKLADKEIRFQVKLVDIKEKIVPELTDEFVKDLGQEIDTVEKLRTRIREDMTTSETNRVENIMRQQLKDKLVGLATFEVPDGMISRELEGMVSNTKYNLSRSGLSMEAMGLSEVKLREDYRPEAEKRVRVALILDKIAKDRSFTVTEEDLNGAIMETARDTGQPPETIREIYNKNNMMDPLQEGILAEKTLKYIIDSATIEETEPSPAIEDQNITEHGDEGDEA